MSFFQHASFRSTVPRNTEQNTENKGVNLGNYELYRDLSSLVKDDGTVLVVDRASCTKRHLFLLALVLLFGIGKKVCWGGWFLVFGCFVFLGIRQKKDSGGHAWED